MSNMAALWGTTVGYTESRYSVTIETNDGRIIVISQSAFDHLYYKLDKFTAALKENCIEYTLFNINEPLCMNPDWFTQAIGEGWICKDEYGGYVFYDMEQGEIPMSPESIVLRNFIGELRYMEPSAFGRYYDILGE